MFVVCRHPERLLVLVLLVVNEHHDLGHARLHDGHEAQSDRVLLAPADLDPRVLELEQVAAVRRQPEALLPRVGVLVGDPLAGALAPPDGQVQLVGAGDDGGATRDAHDPVVEQLVAVDVHRVQVVEAVAVAKRPDCGGQFVDGPSGQKEAVRRVQGHLVRVGGETLGLTRRLGTPGEEKKNTNKKLKIMKENIDSHPSRRKEMFYLTTHSTHFIYGYMASDI